MEIRHLRYFLAAAELQHMTLAAEALGIQQPPLSQQIKKLETELGVALFTRHAKGLKLTQAGQLLRGDAERLLGEFEAVRARMQRYTDGCVGSLTVGFTSSSAAHAFTPEVLRRCRRMHPGIALNVSENSAAAITEAVAQGQLHCGFIRAPVAWPEHVAQEVLLEEPLWVALPIDHPLARQHPASRGAGPLPMQALHQQDFIFVRRPGAPGVYASFQQACQQHGVEIRVVAEVERMMTNLNLVAAGVGLSVVPESMRSVHRNAIAFRRLDAGLQLAAPLTLLYRSHECVGPTATFVRMVTQLAHSKARRNHPDAQPR